MSKFLENLRKSTDFINNVTRGTLEKKVPEASSWDREQVSEVLEDRWAGLDKTENPKYSFSVNIPRTVAVKNLQTGRYKLDNDTNLTGINNDNALYIVGNTYQENSDGTYYGMGWDGRPYSYKIENDVVGSFTPLGVDEQKKAIDRLSNGKIKIDKTITNPATLAQIYRSVKRMQENRKGNLINDNIVIGDSFPEGIGDPEQPNILGRAGAGGGTREQPDSIELFGSNFPAIQANRNSLAKKEGWFANGSADSVAQHELAHTAEFALLNSPERYYKKVAEDAKQYEGKYSAGDLWSDAIGKIKYALPLLSDAVFGTHLVPSKEEVQAMSTDKNSNIKDIAKYWADYYRGPEDKYNTVEEKKLSEARSKIKEWQNKYSTGEYYSMQKNLFDQAAKNTGFDSIEDAMKTISGYAKTNEDEAFAEAYSDVLLNGNKAKTFSKELIRLYSEAADDAAKTFGKNKPTQLQLFQQLTEILPKEILDNPKAQLNRFQSNYQKFVKQ